VIDVFGQRDNNGSFECGTKNYLFNWIIQMLMFFFGSNLIFGEANIFRPKESKRKEKTDTKRR